MRKKWACLIAAVLLVLLSGCGESEKTFSSLDDLAGASVKIAAPTGSASDFAVRERFPENEIVNYNAVVDGGQAVSAGKVDAFAFDKVNLSYYARTNSDTVVMDETLESGVKISGALRPEDTELCEAINGVLAVLEEDGTLAEMQRRWMESDDPKMPELEKPVSPQGTLRILTEGMCEPFNYAANNGEVVGFDVELGLRIAYALNLDAEIQTMPFGALITSLLSGKGDIILSDLNATPERAKSLLFTEPYLTTEIGVLVLADRYEQPVQKISLSGAQLEEQLQNAKVGAVVGSRGAAFMEETYPSAELLQFDSANDAVAALRSGKLDFVISGFSVVANYAKANEDVVYVDYPLTDEGLAVAVAKGNEELLHKMNACIQTYWENGVLEDMKRRWYESTGDYEMADIPAHEDGEVLRVAVAANQEPVCFVYNNQLAGHDYELMQRLAWDLGMRLEVQDMSLSAKIAALQSGKVDVSPSLVPTEERKKAVDFTEVYFDNPQLLMMRTPANSKANQSFLAQLSGIGQTLQKKFTATFLTEQRWRMILRGLLVTVEIAVLAFLLATVWGCVLLAMERGRWRVLRGIASAFQRFVEGTPMLVVLMLLYYLVFRRVNISSILVAILGFGLYYGAGLAGVFRTGLDSVDKGQREAAAALGFRPFEVFRKIVLPQAVRRVFGLYKGQFVSLVKATSIVGYIAIQDLTKASDLIRSRTFDAFFPLIATALIYFALIWLMTALLSLVERKLNPKNGTRLLKGVKQR